MMQVKSIKLLSIIMITLSAILLLSGCGKSGSRFANQPPTIRITSFEGWDSTYVTAGYDTSLVYTFQQRIYWHATDPDGIITGYAFRVLDENNNPIPTPGYDYIDTTGELTPDNLLAFGTGWVIHYMQGADQNIPLDDPSARRTIWTSQKYAVINFPSADAYGNPIDKSSRFEVVAIDNRGAITPQPAWRNFCTHSDRPTCSITTTKGNPNNQEVGSGLKLSFAMKDTDPFITPVPYQYEFQMMKVDSQGNVIPGTESDWYSTISDNNRTDKINEYLLTKHTTPYLTYDYDEQTGQPLQQRTRVTARVTDLAGVVSIPDTNTVINFRVRPGFRPESIIYPTKTYALTNHHFEDYGDDTTPELTVLPRTITQGSIHYATPLFKDFEGKYTAVYSPNIKLWVRWGWWGEYGDVRDNSADYGDTTNLIAMPYGKKVDVVLDSKTRKNYFSEITAFDIRFDGEPYNYPPFPFSQNGVTDQDGKRWLRIPTNSPLGQTVVLTSGQLPAPVGTGPGKHTFEVRVVDLQDEYDHTPAVFTFYLHPYIEPANRNGVLIVDDDVDSPNQAPDALIDEKYANMLSDYTGPVDVYSRRTHVKGKINAEEDIRGRSLAFSDLQKYKLVIYHSDNINDTGNLLYELDGLSLFMMKGGNMVISHSHRLSPILSEIADSGTRPTFVTNLGFESNPKIGFLNDNNRSAFFQNAVACMAGYENMHLQYGTPPSFLNMVNLRHGLGTLSYFEEGHYTGEAIYKFGCKPVGYEIYPPTNDQYNFYNGKTVAFRKVNPSNSRAYVFGFPLSLMKDSETKAMMNKILSEVM